MNHNARSISIRVVATAVVVLTCSTRAESAREFSVASVKPDHLGNQGGEGSEQEKVTSSPTGVTLQNVTLGWCIRWAYGVRGDQISGPGWLASERYDIAAKASAPASSLELKSMMQRLLSDRFKLQLRRELKDLPVYVMLAANGATKLNAASGGESSMLPNGGALLFRNYSMAQFAERLGSRPVKLDRLVLDRTGLDGLFDFEIQFAANDAELKHTLEGIEQGGEQGPSLFTLLRQQLGLTFKAQKAPVETLVIEHAEKVPTDN